MAMRTLRQLQREMRALAEAVHRRLVDGAVHQWLESWAAEEPPQGPAGPEVAPAGAAPAFRASEQAAKLQSLIRARKTGGDAASSAAAPSAPSSSHRSKRGCEACGFCGDNAEAQNRSVRCCGPGRGARCSLRAWVHTALACIGAGDGAGRWRCPTCVELREKEPAAEAKSLTPRAAARAAERDGERDGGARARPRDKGRERSGRSKAHRRRQRSDSESASDSGSDAVDGDDLWGSEDALGKRLPSSDDDEEDEKKAKAEESEVQDEAPKPKPRRQSKEAKAREKQPQRGKEKEKEEEDDDDDDEEEEDDEDPAGPNRSGCVRAEPYQRAKKRLRRWQAEQRLRAQAQEAEAEAPKPRQASTPVSASARGRLREDRATLRGYQRTVEDIPILQCEKNVNLRVQQKKLAFQRSKIHDWGVIAMEDIEPDQLVIEYIGE